MIEALRLIDKVAIVLAVVSTVLAVALGWSYWQQSQEWNPLGEYPTQEVRAVRATEVDVHGIKCNDSDAPVTVRGTGISWQRVNPRGAIIESSPGGGTAERPPGCLGQDFTNAIPEQVFAEDLPGALWRITGTEVPFEDGREGVPRTWETELFDVPG